MKNPGLQWTIPLQYRGKNYVLKTLAIPILGKAKLYNCRLIAKLVIKIDDNLQLTGVSPGTKP